MAALDPSLTTVLVGGASGLVTLLVSKWLDNTHGDRRDAAAFRRQADQARLSELMMLRDLVGALRADNAGLRATLAAHDIPLPPPPLLLHSPGDPE